jgi:endogenous inhibitor of DNA gyrase (YacG/DUF329 family)
MPIAIYKINCPACGKPLRTGQNKTRFECSNEECALIAIDVRVEIKFFNEKYESRIVSQKQTTEKPT